MASERACATADLRRHLSATHKEEFMALPGSPNYNYALYRITTQLQLCSDKVTEESKLEKTFKVNETSYFGHGRDSGKHGSRGKKNKHGGRKNKNTRGNPYEKEHDTDAKQSKGKELVVNPSKKTNKDQHCFRCGRNNHWYRTCRTPDYLCELFTKNEKKKATKAEMNLSEASVSTKSPKLDVSSYLVGFEGTKYESDFDQFANGLFSVN
ncbi:uncharacterized protein LOC113316537 [Papaver somniferum]|uniref:uncharacterized protein LOC113316537 n=1 Tax=Papaver somniferum TaxID=3469 RepID=UPI000E6F66C8|nr:uncharacterized protein LOC113316537 [Papaver somniferum]